MIFLQDNTDVISLGHQFDTSDYFYPERNSPIVSQLRMPITNIRKHHYLCTHQHKKRSKIELIEHGE